ncbi:hypothetical protein PR048_026676 [Dryococelus australis]|uniref:Uncharacterized protein n=1 Tax=Dryococelus australis TaxID=614101 RepID=A0ABQ9GM17_9NEOP|nr:hypothetical protein PR048_026676 [Dryococelus australis]
MFQKRSASPDLICHIKKLPACNAIPRSAEVSTVLVAAVTRTGLNPLPGHSRIFTCGNRAGPCRWLAGFLGDNPFPPAVHSILTSVILIGSQDLAVKSRPNRFAQTHSLTNLKAGVLISSRRSNILLDGYAIFSGVCSNGTSVFLEHNDVDDVAARLVQSRLLNINASSEECAVLNDGGRRTWAVCLEAGAAVNEQTYEAQVCIGLWSLASRSLNLRNFPIPNIITEQRFRYLVFGESAMPYLSYLRDPPWGDPPLPCTRRSSRATQRPTFGNERDGQWKQLLAHYLAVAMGTGKTTNSDCTRQQNGVTAQQHVRQPVCNQLLVTYLPSSSPANREAFAARSNQSYAWIVPRASRSQSKHIDCKASSKVGNIGEKVFPCVDVKDKLYLKHMYIHIAFAIGSPFVRGDQVNSGPIADIQGTGTESYATWSEHVRNSFSRNLGVPIDKNVKTTVETMKVYAMRDYGSVYSLRRVKSVEDDNGWAWSTLGSLLFAVSAPLLILEGDGTVGVLPSGSQYQQLKRERWSYQTTLLLLPGFDASTERSQMQRQDSLLLRKL